MKDCPKARAVLEYGGSITDCWTRSSPGVSIGLKRLCTCWIKRLWLTLLLLSGISETVGITEFFWGVMEYARVIWEIASCLSHDFQIFNLVEKPMLPILSENTGWMKPETGGNQTCFGLIARDNDDFILGGRIGTLKKVLNAEWAEIKAMEESISYTRLKGWNRVVLETDCASIVNRFNKRIVDLTVMGHRMRHLFKLADPLLFFIFNWIPRSCNRVVDMLCKLAKDIPCNVDFNVDYPLEVHDFILKDAIN
ncbi:Transcription factor TFIIIB component B'' [Gossypium australe]|uniref:Transcription factor TFIIIB component B n=1 Tax=Gossypium australe TaxID=47621 RepID=A0A5B6U6D4_9ROSI|nr:Transcription factor TFIIIB component B'' [Gossypium australe]